MTITGGLDKSRNIVYSLSQKEVNLIEKLRMMPFGQVKIIIMEDGEPVRIKRIWEESIKL